MHTPKATEDWSERRTDARRNHERIIAAAFQVFADRGLDGTVPEVAARAGVGKATVYRSYPTKDDLVQAVVRRRFGQLEDRTAEALAEPDAGRALTALLPDVFEIMAADRLLADVIHEQQSPVLLGMITSLIDAAKEQGAVRPDVTGTDVRILAGGCAKQLVRLGITDPAQWRHFGDLVVAALRTR